MRRRIALIVFYLLADPISNTKSETTNVGAFMIGSVEIPAIR
jgi:hypothetical protein